MADPLRPRHRAGLPMWAAVLVVGTVIVGAGSLVVRQNQPMVPTRADAERFIAAKGGPAGTATCEEPDTDGWMCWIRDSEGRYGTAWGRAVVDQKVGRRGTDRHTSWSWGFPVAADGTVESTKVNIPNIVVASRSATLGTGGALVSVRATPQLVHFTCPATVAVGQTVTCTGSGPIPVLTVSRTGDTVFRTSYRVPVPAGQVPSPP